MGTGRVRNAIFTLHFDLMEGALNDVEKARRDAIQLAEQGKKL
jgi:hypothetical protein